jgi:hypothetical protein
MADAISNIVDPSVYPELDKLIAKLVDVEGEITTINNKNISIMVDMKGAENLTRLTELINQQQVNIEKLNGSTQEYIGTANQLGQVQAQIGTASAATVRTLVEQKQELGYVNQQIKFLNQDLAIGAGNYEKNIALLTTYTQRQIQLKQEINQTSTALKDVTVNVNQTNNSFTVMGVNVESVFARMAVRMIAMQLLFVPIIDGITAAVEWFTKLSDAEQLAADRLKEYNDEMKETANIAAGEKALTTANIIKERQEADRLISTLADEKATRLAKLDAIKQLQALQPGLLNGYKEEALLNLKSTDEIQNHSNAITNLEGKINSLNKTYNAQVDIFSKTKDKVDDLKKVYGDKWMEGDKTTAANFTKQLDDMTKSGIELDALKRQLANIDSPEENLNKPKKEKSDYEIKKRAIEAEFELNKRRIEGERDTAKKILDNEDLSLNERYKANFDYQASLIDLSSNELNKGRKINNLDVEYKKENPKTALDKNKAEALKYENDFQKIKADGIARIDAMQKASDEKWVKSQKDKFEESQALELHNSAYEETLLNKRLKNNLISQEDYETELDKLLEKRKEKELEAQLAFDKELAFSGKLTDDEKAALLKKIAQLEAEIAALTGKKKKDDEKPTGAFPELEQGIADLKPVEGENPQQKFARELDALKNFSAQSIEIYQELAAAIKQINDNQIAQEQQNLEIKSRAIQLAYREQVDAVNASAGYQITKENELAKMAAQNAAQQNAIQQQQNQLALKKAISDKTAAEAGIVANTALAITKALPMLGTPATAAIGAAEIALISAIGAVQYAAAASTPLPQFEGGGTTYTKYFIAGEAGAERMTTPDGQTMIADKPGIYSAPIGTKIDTAAETAALMRFASANIGLSVDSRGELKEGKNEMTDKRIVEKLDDLNDTMRQTAMMQKTIKNHINISGRNDLQLYQ